MIILGINHQRQEGLYSISPKNYITPFGKLFSDRDMIEAIERRVPKGTLASDDFGHMADHSIEFQTLFIANYLGHGVPIVPVLCGSLHELLWAKRNIFDDDRFTGMAESLRELLVEQPGKTLLVAGVDLSHIGLKFGSGVPADEIISIASANDDYILSALSSLNTAAIYENALESQDRFNVCGLPAILLLSMIMNDVSAEILNHDVYEEPATKSAVTYASAVFSRT